MKVSDIGVTASTPSTTADDSQSGDIRQVITKVADSLGVPPPFAIAIAEQESGLNPNAVSDNGHSVGLFQLNDEGEGAGMSVAERENPETNARIALTRVAAVLKANPRISLGEVAALAQRPADPTGYAEKLNKTLSQNGFGGVATTMSTGVGAGDSGAVGAASTGYQQSGAAEGAPLNAHPTLNAQQLASEYGFAAAFFQSDPELSNLLKQAVAQQWTPDLFTAKLQATNWYQTHSQNVRDFITLQKTDPATFNEKLAREKTDVQSIAATIGAQLDGDTLGSIAENAIKFGWDQAQIQRALGAHVSLTSGGQTADNEQTMRGYLAQQGIQMSNPTINNYLKQIESGTSTIQDFEANVRRLAASAFPAYSQQIEGGTTVQQIADPYVQDMASILEINPDKITLQNPTIRKALTATDSKGQPTQSGLWQFEQGLRSDPRWRYTQNAANVGYALLHKIGQDWGFES